MLANSRQYRNRWLVKAAANAPQVDLKGQANNQVATYDAPALREAIAQVAKAAQINITGPQDHIDVVRKALECFCVDPERDASPEPEFTPLERLAAQSRIAVRTWHYDPEDLRAIELLSQATAVLNGAVIADMFRRPGYETPSTALVAQDVVGVGQTTLQLQIGNVGPNVLVPAFMIELYTSSLNNIGIIKGSITATMKDGSIFDSRQFTVRQKKSNKSVALLCIPHVLLGAQLFPGLAEVSSTQMATLNLTQVAAGTDVAFYGVTPTVDVYQDAVRMIANCPGDEFARGT
jgi:hypothetical protein